jgi:predicted nucleic acid-binding protein
MIVADTNVWIAYLAGETGEDISWLDSALGAEATAMAPMVLAELLTAPALAPEHARALIGIPLLSLTPDYWVRVGKLRASLQAKRYRPRLVDTMIAQLCMDHQATLLTRDAGFKRFVGQGLKLH